MNTLEQLSSYLEKGWKLIPLTEGSKLPFFTKWGEEPIDSQVRLEFFYKSNPEYNWGLVTGKVSNIIVIDVDPKNGGSLTSLPFPKTLTVKTANGGYHLYFNYPGFEVRNSVSKLAKGIDVRGDGGYVVIPPSSLGDGKNYEWLNNVAIADFPAFLFGHKDKPRLGLPETLVEGERNDVLFKFGCSLRAKGSSEDEILTALQTLNHKRGNPPLDDDEIEIITKNVCRYEQGNSPIEITTRENLTLTDLGNAERLVKRYGEKLRYCFELGDWLIWNGKNWEIDAKEEIKTLAYATAKSIYDEAANTKDTLESRSIGDWAKSSLSSFRINNMIEMAKSLLPIGSKELDSNAYLVNLENGVLDLLTGKLLPHDPNLYMTKIIHVEYSENANCPKWNEFLDMVLPEKEVQRFLQKAIGYSLTGSTDAQALFFLYGLGANGKSTLIETIRRLFGDYSQRADIEALLDNNRGNSANPYVARLFKTRFVVSSEIPDGKKFNESLIKDLTGSDVLVARKLYQEPFEFIPTHKLWLVGNYKPNVQDMSLGFWRRMRVIPFTVTIPKENQREISEVLKEFENESSGILNWAIQGAILWRKEGLVQPEAVKKATEEYRTEQDLFQQFLDEEMEFGDFRISKDDLLEKLNAYLYKSGEKRTYSMNKITRELSTKGIATGGMGRRFFIGLRLRPEENTLFPVGAGVEERVRAIFNN